MSLDFPALDHPVIQAPMAGGPSTPALAAAVSNAGGMGFLAAGYKSADELRADMGATRRLTSGPVGVNLFLVGETPVDHTRLAAFTMMLEPEARRYGVTLGEPLFDDDALEAKLEIVCLERPPAVSFTFGCPSPEVIQRLHDCGIAVWITVTEAAEALLAGRVGADALIVQGVEAGGHRGSFQDIDGYGEIGLLSLLRLVARVSELPLIASGGIADGLAIAAVLIAGARAAQIGTAFMRCPEAATCEAHRDALAKTSPTALTRAFSGRRARGIVNAFMHQHGSHAPSAYPHVNHLTAPLRAAAREAGDADGFNLWAGQAHTLAEDRPAAELVRLWSAEARATVEQARF